MKRDSTSSPFYDHEFARQRRRGGQLVAPEEDEYLRTTVAVPCSFAVFGMEPQPGMMVFHHGSDYAEFISDDHTTRTVIALSALRFTEERS